MLFSPSPHRERVQLRLTDRRRIFIVGDMIAVLVAVFIALVIWARVADDPFTFEFIIPQSYWFVLLPFLWWTLASANDFYDPRITTNRSQTLQRLLSITAQMIVVYLLVFFFSPRDALPRLFILYYGVASFVFIAAWRGLSFSLFGWAAEARKVLVIGTGTSAVEIIKALHDTPHAYQIRGVIGTTDEIGQTLEGVPVVGTGDDLMNFIHRDRISELVLTSTRDLSSATFQGVMDAYEQGVAILPMPLLYERLTGRVPVEHVRDNWAVVLPIENERISALAPYQLAKRLLEVALSLVGIAGFAVLYPLMALIIKLDSPGTVFYTQERVGLNGRVFKIYKFRTMTMNAEAASGAVFSHKNDARVTRTGRFMRKTRLDELPQLLNILRGDMSLIGPRPERPEHVKRLTAKIPFYRTRHVVKPGLTGWAQVRYHYGANDDDALMKLQYDLYYIRHQSLLLDFMILVRTVGRVLKMSGM